MKHLTKFAIIAVSVILATSCVNKGKNANAIDPDDTIKGRKVLKMNPDKTPKVVAYFKVDKDGNITNELVREVHYRPGKKKYTDGGFKDNQRSGLWHAYHENGNIQTEATYVDGKENGLYKVFHENGKLYYSGEYNMGTCVGTWSFYDDKGNLVKTLNADPETLICGSCPRCKAVIEKKQLGKNIEKSKEK